MDICILEQFIIRNTEDVEERLKSILNNNSATLTASIKYIQSEISTIFYFDAKLNLKPDNDKDVIYAWLDTGYCNQNSEPIFISLVKNEDKFTGNYIGTSKTLASSTINYFPNNRKFIYDNQNRFIAKYEKRISKRTTKHIEIPEYSLNNIESTEIPTTEIINKIRAVGLDITNTQEENQEEIIPKIPKTITPVTEEIFNQLLVQNWKSIEGLDRYIKIIGCRIQQLVDQKNEQYYIMNHLGYVIINTGLLNLFGTDILLYYRINKKYNIYEAYEVVYGKTDYLKNDFTKEQASKELNPINFFNDDDIFSVDIDVFDINYRNLLHIIDERRERFPDNIKDLSTNIVATRLRNALTQGLKIQQRDKNYVKAHYSTKTRSISWIMPFHINTDLLEEPELVLIIRKNHEFFEVKTILPYDDKMKDRITSLSLYSKLW